MILLGHVKRAKQKSINDGFITSIYFHNPARNIFEKLIIWLKKNEYAFLTSEQLVKIIHMKMACPKKAVWISLDDAWQANVDNVIPIAIQYNIPITIFVCTGAIEDGTFWWRKIEQSQEFLSAEFRNAKVIRKLPEYSRKKTLKLIDKADLSFKREAMTVEDIKRIAVIPQVTLGAHTVLHPILPNCTDDEIEHELAESKRRLEEWIGKSVTTFAYPNGAFDGRESRFLEQHGYELAATTESGYINPGINRYLIPRAGVMDDGSFTENLCHALGIWEPVVNKLKKIISLKY